MSPESVLPPLYNPGCVLLSFKPIFCFPLTEDLTRNLYNYRASVLFLNLPELKSDLFVRKIVENLEAPNGSLQYRNSLQPSGNLKAQKNENLCSYGKAEYQSIALCHPATDRPADINRT